MLDKLIFLKDGNVDETSVLLGVQCVSEGRNWK